MIDSLANATGKGQRKVLQEFFFATTRKLGVQPVDARRLILECLDAEMVPTTPELVVGAIDLSIVTGLSLWDSLILQTAVVGRCEILYTEDLGHGQRINGVRIVNPFKSGDTGR